MQKKICVIVYNNIRIVYSPFPINHILNLNPKP